MKRWLQIFTYIAGIWAFISLVPMMLNRVKMYRNVINASERLGIDNSALFYTEEARTAHAESELKARISINGK